MIAMMVGARGFEPPTPRSRTVCATRLRYAPTEARTRKIARPLAEGKPRRLRAAPRRRRQGAADAP